MVRQFVTILPGFPHTFKDGANVRKTVSHGDADLSSTDIDLAYFNPFESADSFDLNLF